MREIAALVGVEHGAEFEALWHEYEAHSSKESVMAHDLDKFDMLQQVAIRMFEFARPRMSR